MACFGAHSGHRWLLEQLLESQTAVRQRNKLPEESHWKDFHNLLAISEKHVRTLFLVFFTKRQKYFLKTIRAHSQNTVLIFTTLKINIS
jgi:hypothetical protein